MSGAADVRDAIACADELSTYDAARDAYDAALVALDAARVALDAYRVSRADRVNVWKWTATRHAAKPSP